MELTGYRSIEDMTPEQLDATFAALADRTRRAILARLATGDATVTELAEPFDMSQPAVSKHLKVLERAGLITRRRDAQRRPCTLEARPLKAATDWLEDYRSYWEESFQRLDRLLGELKAEEKRRTRRAGTAKAEGRGAPAAGGAGTRQGKGRAAPTDAGADTP